jgi:hypothetical protein
MYSMKTRSFLTALVLLVSTAVFAQGTGPRMAIISHGQSDSFKVIYEGIQPGNVNMTIRDANGSLVFFETTKNVEGFIRRVNFKGMQSGEYSIRISGEDGEVVQKVAYDAGIAIGKNRVAKLSQEERGE